MQSANRFSALESDDEVEVPQVPVKKQTTEKKVEKKNEKKQPVVEVKKEQEKKPKNVNKNEGVEMEFKKPDSRRGISDQGNRENYAPRQGKRQFDRHDGTGRGFRSSKKEGAGQHNWGNEVQEELNNVNGLEEVSQVPASEQANIEKSEQIGKGIEEESSEKKEENEKAKVEAQKEKQLTFLEYRKQQEQARKYVQNKELFASRQERSADFPADEQVQKIESTVDEDFIKSSVAPKTKKNKTQRSQKIVVLEKELIGFTPHVRRQPRADKPRAPEGSQRREGGEKKGDEKPQRREGGERGAPRANNYRGDYQGRPRNNNQRGGQNKLNIEDEKSFPTLK